MKHRRKILWAMFLAICMAIGVFVATYEPLIRGFGVGSGARFIIDSTKYELSLKLKKHGNPSAPYAIDCSITLHENPGSPNYPSVQITAIHPGNRLEGIDGAGNQWGPFKIVFEQPISDYWHGTALKWNTAGTALVYDNQVTIYHLGRDYYWGNLVAMILWPVIFGGCIGFLCWGLIFFFTPTVLRLFRRRHPWPCPNCGYDQRGSAAAKRCPECGWIWPDCIGNDETRKSGTSLSADHG